MQNNGCENTTRASSFGFTISQTTSDDGPTKIATNWNSVSLVCVSPAQFFYYYCFTLNNSPFCGYSFNAIFFVFFSDVRLAGRNVFGPLSFVDIFFLHFLPRLNSSVVNFFQSEGLLFYTFVLTFVRFSVFSRRFIFGTVFIMMDQCIFNGGEYETQTNRVMFLPFIPRAV